MMIGNAVVDNLVRDTLWTELLACYDEHAVNQYRTKICEYVYMRYKVAA